MNILITSPFQAKIGGESLSELFKPLELLNITSIYEQYSTLIDFTIYLLIFVGLAQITLGKHFQGRGGKAITIGIGISLAVSLAIAEQYIGFSIRSFGPIAAGIFLALIGFMIYRLVKHLGAGMMTSSSAAYIIVLLSMVAVVPGFFAWINQAMPLLNLILVICLFIAIYNVISHLFKKHGIPGKLRTQLGQVKEKYDNATGGIRKEEKQEHKIQQITKEAFKNSNQILNDLLEVLKSIKQYGHIPTARNTIKEQIEKILPEQNELLKILIRLKTLHKKILSFDLSIYSSETQNKYQPLNDKEKEHYKKQLEEEYRKIGIEKQLPELEDKIQFYQKDIKECLRQTSLYIMNGDIQDSQNMIMRAINLEKETTAILGELKTIEKQILKHAQLERRTENAQSP